LQEDSDENILKPPSSDVVERCITNFIDRTSNEALAMDT
jgi:hypothetical protein